MKVGWDARILVNGELRGMGTYALHLLPALRDCRPDLELILFHDGDRAVPLSGFRSARIGPTRGYRWQLWERLGLPLHAYMQRCDVLHSPANTTPPYAPLRRIVTLHDAMPFLQWNRVTPALEYFRETQRNAVKRADLIITDSEYSRQDICQTLDVAPSRVTVIPLAPSPELQPPDPSVVSARLTTLGVRQRFVLGLAASAARKNTKGVIRAFAQVQDAFPDLSLALTGVTTSLTPIVHQALLEHGVSLKRAVLLDFVTPEDLAVLYAGCQAFLFLSLYEGFGLPIIDAMQCGAPVICSNRTSCPEVAGDAAVVVDPERSDEVASAIADVLGRSDQERERWRVGGHTQASTFSWTRTAEMTAHAYEVVAGSVGRTDG